MNVDVHEKPFALLILAGTFSAAQVALLRGIIHF
jgi:hypothetical protein